MILDNTLALSAEQDLTLAAIWTVSQNVINLSHLRDMGEGNSLYVVFEVTEAFASATAAELQLATVISPATNMATTPVVLSRGPSAGLLSQGLVAAAMPLGAQFVVPIGPIPSGATPFLYMAALYVQPLYATASFTAGKMSAYITPNPVVMDHMVLAGGSAVYSSGGSAGVLVHTRVYPASTST